MSPKEYNKVSAAVRILHQKRDASARATHLMVKNDSLITYETGILGQAVIKKFFITTFLERKIMSTKTSFKRIALVAASALALAGFSVISAPQASAADITSMVVSKLTKVNGIALTSANYTSASQIDSRGISSFNVTAGDTVTLVFVATGGTTTATTDSLTVTWGYGNLLTNDTITAVSATGTAAATGAPFQSNRGNGGVMPSTEYGTFTATSVAGTYPLTITLRQGLASTAPSGLTTLTTTVNMVVGAASTLDLGQSTAYMTGTTGGAAASSTTNAVPRSGSKTAGTYIAQVGIVLLKADGTADTAAHTITATINGQGYVAANVTADTDPASTARVATNSAAASARYVHIEADGTAGAGTVTVSVTHASTAVTTTLGTFSFTTYGSVTKFAVSTTNYTIGAAGGDTTGYGGTTRTVADNDLPALDNATTVPAFIVAATDSGGRAANLAPSIVSSASSVVASGTCALDGGALPTTASSSTNGVGYYNCSFTTAASAKSGDKATLTIRAVDPADSTKYLTTTIDVTVGSTTVATETLSLDKTSYTPGEALIVTRTAKDASGNPVADGTDAPAVKFTKAPGGTAPAASNYVGGKLTTSATAPSVFAPAVSGDFNAYMTSGNAAGSTITATASVEGDSSSALALDAANAATDAANNAYDEAQNATQAASDALAAVTALADQVTGLIASVKKLTAAVAKLSKKK